MIGKKKILLPIVGEKYSGIISSSLKAGPRPSGPR